MKITKWYKLVKAARRAGGDKYQVVPDEEGRKTQPPPTHVLYIDQAYSRGLAPGIVKELCVTFDFGEEADGL